MMNYFLYYVYKNDSLFFEQIFISIDLFDHSFNDFNVYILDNEIFNQIMQLYNKEKDQ
jgi:hypothetical protein